MIDRSDEISVFDPLLLENQLCFPLYICAKEVIRLYTPYLDKIGLTYTQYITMMVMWEEKQVLTRRLRERLFLDSGTLTPVLNKLEQKGLVTKTRSAEDARDLVVSITSKGEQLREDALSIPEKVAVCLKPVAHGEAMYQGLMEMMEHFRDRNDQ